MQEGLTVRVQEGPVDESVVSECANCGGFYRRTCIFKNSSLGEIRLCVDCRPVVMDASFGKIDASLHRTAGSFEGGKKRKERLIATGEMGDRFFRSRSKSASASGGG